MTKLFEKTQIGSIELANRTVRSATWSGVGDERGYVTDLAEAIYGNLASGGIGLIITGYQYVMTNGIQLPFMIGNYDDDQLEGLSGLANLVHAQGGRIVPQLVHTGVRANKKLFRQGEEVWGPSGIPDPMTGAVPMEVSKAQIRELVEAYARAAERSKNAGFDGIQLHGAHGYGINQFLSPVWNKRSDAYGGDVKKRYKFLAEVMEAVRGAVGDNFPILIKLNGHDFVERGLVPEESVRIAKMLQDDGISAIEVSGGSAASPENLGPVRRKVLKEEDEAYFADIARFFKESVEVPIITVGGIRSLKTIDDILDGKKADYVSMARPFIREPHLINRWESGDTEKSKCIACNGCFEMGLQGQGISCKVERKKKEEAS
jgi:2,4-dienoyl-CoA reductase-like NADH-dependent reductase (Old Yellow Enzyme family)